MRCWSAARCAAGGSDTYGQLGYGNPDVIGDDETPASVGDVDIGGKVTQISSG